jgi:hypothetical protein
MFGAPERIPRTSCWQIEATMLTGSGRSPVRKARGRTSRRNAIAKIRSASARTCTEHVTWSSGSSTRSSSVGALQLATTSSRPTTLLSSSLLPFEFGYAFMSPRPRPKAEGIEWGYSKQSKRRALPTPVRRRQRDPKDSRPERGRRFH